jgi:oligoendopeptidase F
MPHQTIPTRSSVDERWTWNHTAVFPDLSAWENAVQSLPKRIETFSEEHASADQSAKDLYAALESKYALMNDVERVYLYASMFHSVDTTDQDAARRQSQARSLYSRAAASLAFLEPTIIETGEAQVHAWMEQFPDLDQYAHYFHNLFRKARHIRSADIETILGRLRDPFAGVSATTRMLTDADFKFDPVSLDGGNEIEITQGNFNTLLTDPERAVREDVWKNYLQVYGSHRNALTSTLETSIKQNVFLAEVRDFDSTLDAALFEHNIPTDVFHSLIDTFQENLPTWHRYFALRREMLGLDELRPFDLWAPLISNRPRIPYEKAVEWITAGLAPMGEDYVESVRMGCLEQRWVDVYPNIGKRKGAFSGGVRGTPPFIVMNYGDTIFNMSTLAHELGHSMHSLLAWRAQPQVYSDYSLFVAEVASNFHQAMVRAHLLETVDDQNTQVAVIEEAMANFLRYFFIMPTLARFELEMHRRVERGEGLNANLMIESMITYLREGFGGEVAFEEDLIGMLWSTFGHLYVDYYVFQYATGISGAHAAARRILSREPGAREAYLDFLQTGDAAYPLDALLKAGIDLRSAEPVETTFDMMSDYVDRLEKIAGSF